MKRFRPAANPHLVRASGDRWLFGYADVVTLLLACFASLYASTLAPAASADIAAAPPEAPAPVARAAESTAVPVAVPAAAASDVDPAMADPSSAEIATDSADPAVVLERDLRALFGTEAAPLGLELSTSDRGLVLSVPEAGSFPPARAELSAAARLMMLGLAAELRGRRHLIRVEGHTDDIPIRTGRYGSNWELSTARATSVVQFLIEEGGLEPRRLSAAGYAEYHPKLDNDSAAHRARNRRVDIVILEPRTAN